MKFWGGPRPTSCPCLRAHVCCPPPLICHTKSSNLCFTCKTLATPRKRAPEGSGVCLLTIHGYGPCFMPKPLPPHPPPAPTPFQKKKKPFVQQTPGITHPQTLIPCQVPCHALCFFRGPGHAGRKAPHKRTSRCAYAAMFGRWLHGIAFLRCIRHLLPDVLAVFSRLRPEPACYKQKGALSLTPIHVEPCLQLIPFDQVSGGGGGGSATPRSVGSGGGSNPSARRQPRGVTPYNAAPKTMKKIAENSENSEKYENYENYDRNLGLS